MGEGILLLEPLGDADHFGAGLFSRNPWLQSGHGNNPRMPIAIIGERGRPRLERDEDIRGLQNLKSGRKHADDRIGLRSESNRFADDFPGAAKAPLPETVAE